VLTSIGSFVTREFGKTLQEGKQMAVMKTMVALPVEAIFSLTDAPSHDKGTWHDIDWRNVHQNVRRLQTRIVKATQAGKWRKVQALQHLLTHSFSGKALAVKRVTENQGKRTAGVDGKIWSTPASKFRAIKTLQQHGYRAQPLRRVYIPKKKGRRPLSIPTMKDRAMQALYKLALDPIAETLGDPNSYGFRKARAAADAIEQCFNVFGQKNSALWILEGDIKSCFDTISHKWLLEHIPIEKPILRQWLKAGFMSKGVLHPTGEGTPQGGIASPVLANMALDGLEAELRRHFPRHKGQSVHLVRYADDFIITARRKAMLENEVKPLVERFLRERGLALSQEKTQITHIEDGFDFLSQNVRKYNGKLLIRPSKESVRTFLNKVRGRIKANKHVTAGQLIAMLNPLIRGWANYHCHVVSKKAFSYAEYHIFWAVWRWARHRHPRKSANWVKKKYFPPWGRRNWHFAGVVKDREGKPQTIRLVPLARIPIRRHRKVRANANPYDPAWETYFEKHLATKMMATLEGKNDLRRLWFEQNGVCPVCRQKITQNTGWHSHHVVWWAYGGGDGLSNRVLLHPNCHRQVHSRGLYVEKPRPTMGV
jgi:RNA-directed DNA polymerase